MNTLAREKKWARALTERKEHELLQVDDLVSAKLNFDDQILWDSLGHTERFICFKNRKFVIYQSKGTRKTGGPRMPTIFTVATVKELNADIYNGLRVTLEDSLGEYPNVSIGPVPQKLFGLDIFLWVSHNPDLQFKIKSVEGTRFSSETTFAIAARMKSHARWFNRGNFNIATAILNLSKPAHFHERLNELSPQRLRGTGVKTES